MIPASTLARPRHFDRDVDGILLLDKPLGLSSNAALQRARSLFSARKAGHAGSLDPLATGMLPLCFGEATKVCGSLLDARKTYVFTARLGQRTDTGDAEGRIVEERVVPALTEMLVRDVLNANIGERTQVPPMYSALKHQGQRLYSLARRGETVERAARPITLERLSLLKFDAAELQVEVRCSKGTYVRTLAEDLAQQLGTVAHLTALRRTEVDPFSGRPMVTLEHLGELLAQIESGAATSRMESLLVPADQALIQFPALDLDAGACSAILHGQSVKVALSAASGELLRLYGPKRRFLGVGEIRGDGEVHPKRLVASRLNPAT